MTKISKQNTVTEEIITLEYLFKVSRMIFEQGHISNKNANKKIMANIQ